MRLDDVGLIGKLLLSKVLDYLATEKEAFGFMPEYERCGKQLYQALIYYSTKKREHSFSILKAFFVRHSSEYETSDNDRKVNRNI